jgi:hypothetical protein
MMRLASLLVLCGGCAITVVDHCTDGTLDGNESDVDCGGSCRLCPDGRRCDFNSDCAGGVCGAGGVCTTGTPSGLPSSAGADTYNIDVGGSVVITPGTQAGYAVLANVGGSFRLVWTGDGATTGSFSNFTGTVWTTAVIDSVSPGCSDGSCALESGDVVSTPTAVTGGYRVDFDTVTSTGIDGFDFTVTAESAAQPVYSDLLIDGQRYPSLVFFSSNGAAATAGTDPFGLTTH